MYAHISNIFNERQCNIQVQTSVPVEMFQIAKK